MFTCAEKSFPHGKIWNTLPLVDVGPQVCPGLLAALGVSKGMPQAQSDVSMPGPPRARHQGMGRWGAG